jgi:hypothetical protein
MNELTQVNGSPPAAISTLDVTALTGSLTNAAGNPNCDPGKMQAIYDVIRQVRADASREAFYADLAAMQGEMEPVIRSTPNPSTKSKYAKFDKIQVDVKPLEKKYGFSITYDVKTVDDKVSVGARLGHRLGHFEDYGPVIERRDMTGAKGNVNKTELHGFGSTVSYLKRYHVASIYNIPLVGEDDDGNEGGGTIGNGSSPPAKSKQPPPKMKPPLDPNSWLGKCEAAIGAAKSDAAWLKLMVEAGNRCPTLNDLNELEEDFAINVAKSPPDVQTAIKTAWAAGRKRLLAENPPASGSAPANEAAKSDTPDEAAFDRYLVDDYGEVLGEAYSSRIKYAEDLLEIWRVADNRETLIANNADAIADAKYDPAAAKMLAEIDDDPGETMDENDPLLVAVPVPVRNGKQDLAQYRRDLVASFKAAETAAANQGSTLIVSAWLDGQREMISQQSPAQRALIGKELTPLLGAAVPEWLTSPRAPGNRAPASPAPEKSPPAKSPDELLADKWIADLQAMPDDGTGRGYFEQLTVVGGEMFKTMLRWRKEKSPLFDLVDKEVAAKQAKLP